MSIDGINKPGGSSQGVPNLQRAGGGESFADKLTAEATELQGTERSEALKQLDAGAISVDEYLDHQVGQAVAHLTGKLPEDQLAFVRETLRAQLTEDPVLIELVRRTTGVKR